MNEAKARRTEEKLLKRIDDLIKKLAVESESAFNFWRRSSLYKKTSGLNQPLISDFFSSSSSTRRSGGMTVGEAQRKSYWYQKYLLKEAKRQALTKLRLNFTAANMANDFGRDAPAMQGFLGGFFSHEESCERCQGFFMYKPATI